MPNMTPTLTPGTRWAGVSAPTADNLRGIAVNESGRWVVASQGAGRSYYSDNYGSSWTVGGTMTNSTAMYGMVYGEGLYVASAGTSGQTIYTSPDGVTWTNRFNPGGGAGWDMYQLIYNDGYFTLGVDDDNAVLFASAAGTSWSVSAHLSTAICVSGIYVSSLGRTFGTTNGGVYKYYNGVPTAASSWPGSATGDMTGTIWGIAWSPTLSLACAVGANGIFTSSDLITWTQRSSVTLFRNVAWCDTQFIAVGDTGKIYTSPDGTTWTSRTSGTSVNLYGVNYYDGVLLVSGDSGVVRKSVD